MKIYITVTFKGDKNKDEIKCLSSAVRRGGFEDFCFVRDVENYKKVFSNTRELMDRAKEEVLKSDALLIDWTEKSTGRTIEAGIAFANNKKIITIIKRGTVLKDTVKGISDIVIEYDKIDDIVKPLKNFYNTLSKDNKYDRKKT